MTGLVISDISDLNVIVSSMSNLTLTLVCSGDMDVASGLTVAQSEQVRTNIKDILLVENIPEIVH